MSGERGISEKLAGKNDTIVLAVCLQVVKFDSILWVAVSLWLRRQDLAQAMMSAPMEDTAPDTYLASKVPNRTHRAPAGGFVGWRDGDITCGNSNLAAENIRG